LSYGYVWLARIYTKQFIWTTGILNIIFGLVTAIYMLSRKYWSGGTDEQTLEVEGSANRT
jgi:hypothetical protein